MPSNFINCSSFSPKAIVYYIWKNPTKRRGSAFYEKRVCQVNIAYFLLPKNHVAYLYDDYTFRQGLEKMRHHGYTAIPVISRSGKYIGTVSEGDFLWKLLAEDSDAPRKCTMKSLEKLQVRDLIRPDQYPSVRITVSMGALMNSAMNQNFIPVVDDLGNFIGIVTRKDIIRYFAEQKEEDCAPPLMQIV